MVGNEMEGKLSTRFGYLTFPMINLTQKKENIEEELTSFSGRKLVCSRPIEFLQAGWDPPELAF